MFLSLIGGVSMLFAQGRGPIDRFAPAGCPVTGSADTNPPTSAIAPTDFVELRRTDCFGTCPVYTVRIQADGQVTWHGQMYVHDKGDSTAKVAAADAASLIEKFRTNAFWSLCASYKSRMTDLATAITVVHIGDQERKVSDDGNSAPKWLVALEREIDALSDTHRWIHGDPKNESFENLCFDAVGPKPGLTPLMRAAGNGNLEEVRNQIAAFADPNERDASGWTPLMYGMQGRSTDVLLVLLDRGANVNARSYMGQTALMAAAMTPWSLDKVRILIAHGADVNAQDSYGTTALTFVTTMPNEEVLSYLLKVGARADLKDAQGHTLLDIIDLIEKYPSMDKAPYERVRAILQNWKPPISN